MSRRQTQPAQHSAHLLPGFLVHLLGGFVERGHHHVLQHLDIARHFRVDLHAQHILLAVHFDRDHSAAGGRLDADQRDLLLHLLLHLLGLFHHGLHVPTTGHFHDSAPDFYVYRTLTEPRS